MTLNKWIRQSFIDDAYRQNLHGYHTMDEREREAYVDMRINSLTNSELLSLISDYHNRMQYPH